MNVKAEVLKELEELRKLDVDTHGAENTLNEQELQEYYDNGMSIGRIADFTIQLASCN